MSTWVLVANAAEAKLFSSDNLRIDGLHHIKDFAHPESRKKISDLVTDKPGHYKMDSGMRGSFAKGDPKDVEIEHFALQLLKELKSGFDKKEFDTLVVVAPHHFYSHIKKHMSFNVGSLEFIAKDYTKYESPKLLTSIREHLFVV